MHLDSLFTSNAFTEKDLQVCTGDPLSVAVRQPAADLRLAAEADYTPRPQLGHPAAHLFPDAARANHSIFYRDGRPASVGEVYANLTRTAGSARRRSAYRIFRRCRRDDRK